MCANNPETIYSAGSGDWTQARLITVSGSACTVPISHRDSACESVRNDLVCTPFSALMLLLGCWEPNLACEKFCIFQKFYLLEDWCSPGVTWEKIGQLNIVSTSFLVQGYCLLFVVVVVVVTSLSGSAYMGGRGADAPKRWGISPDCHCPGTHLWCHSVESPEYH